jgi:hypothetical protein
MKSFLRLNIAFITILTLLVVPAAAFARAASHKGAFTVDHSVYVDGHSLPAGSYELRWSGDGPSAQVQIMRQGKVVAKATAQVVQLTQKATYDEATEKTEANGQHVLDQVVFSGRTDALTFNPTPSSASHTAK